jgi:predicted GNAT family N-acyltransferase
MEEEEELDGLDHLAHHYLAILDGRAVATARWRLGPQVPVLRLERLAVLPAFRSQGIATKLVTRMMGDMHEDLPLETRSSLAAIPFFELLGFEKKGEPYEVGGVAIVDMAIGGGR